PPPLDQLPRLLPTRLIDALDVAVLGQGAQVERAVRHRRTGELGAAGGRCRTLVGEHIQQGDPQRVGHRADSRGIADALVVRHVTQHILRKDCCATRLVRLSVCHPLARRTRTSPLTARTLRWTPRSASPGSAVASRSLVTVPVSEVQSRCTDLPCAMPTDMSPDAVCSCTLPSSTAPTAISPEPPLISTSPLAC